MRLALIGIPNSGKTTLFNRITGLNAQVGNYPGTTVSFRSAQVRHGDRDLEVVDVPGLYSLNPQAPDEQIAVTSLASANALVCVLDATNLARSLYLALMVKEVGLPVVYALNMVDAVSSIGQGLRQSLSELLEAPVVPTVARSGEGLSELLSQVPTNSASTARKVTSTSEQVIGRFGRIDEVLKPFDLQRSSTSERWDRWLLSPWVGGTALVLAMLILFQAVFAWAQPVVSFVESLMGVTTAGLNGVLPESLFRSLLVDGVVAGVGNVLVFVPQLAFLFFLLSLMEDCGYLARAAFLLDRPMRAAGLNGRAFIPLLQSFACAIPGVMATRSMRHRQDRLRTIMVAPFMSCSARLPVYTLVVAAVFSTAPPVWGFLSVGGLVFTTMYLLGIAAALVVAWVMRLSARGQRSAGLSMDMPDYKIPSLRTAWRTTYERCRIFVVETGTTILILSVLLWAALTFPGSRPDEAVVAERAAQIEQAKGPAAEELMTLFARQDASQDLRNSFGGRIGQAIEPVIAPLGFDWRIGIGLVASFAAREVLVSALAQVYALDPDIDAESPSLREAILADRDPQTGKPRFTALVGISLMVFFVLAMQCLSTVAVVQRETGSWRFALLQLVLMNTVAYLAALLVYQGGKLLGYA